MYNGQKSSSKKRGFPQPKYTKEELYIWLHPQKKFHKLYKKWKKSGYLRDLKPSIDRKDDYVGYEFDNIQLMTFKENETKSHNDRKAGINNKMNVSVNQFDLDGNFVATYYSMAEATRQTNISQPNISNVCNSTRNSAGGYIWRLTK